MMTAILRDLERNIESELSVQLRIQDLLDRQLDILLRGKAAELGDVLAAAESGMAESGRLEAERLVLIGKAGDALGIPAKEVTLKRIEAAAGAAAAALADRGTELKECLARIRETNRRVALLLRHSVLFLDDLLAAVAGGAPRAEARTYTRGAVHAGATANQLAAEA
ncbi:MAG: flagellar protein FlgN [Planctomycetes bacterium]|nr:flagellar protein FlgN [Planctomycetota bacterium]